MTFVWVAAAFWLTNEPHAYLSHFRYVEAWHPPFFHVPLGYHLYSLTQDEDIRTWFQESFVCVEGDRRVELHVQSCLSP